MRAVSGWESVNEAGAPYGLPGEVGFRATSEKTRQSKSTLNA